jgi:adenylylsulfate kinase
MKPGMGLRMGLRGMSAVEKGFTLWFTGLPSSGKTTLATLMADKLRDLGIKVELLDGDEVRKSLSPDLGFSKNDRETHAQRVAYLCRILSRNGIAAIASLISPYKASRQQARDQVGSRFIEVWTKCTLEKCMERDLKGLYKKALEGKIRDMTGVQDPYEEPVDNEVTVDTEHNSVDKCATQIMFYLVESNYLKVPQRL